MQLAASSKTKKFEEFYGILPSRNNTVVIKYFTRQVKTNGGKFSPRTLVKSGKNCFETRRFSVVSSNTTSFLLFFFFSSLLLPSLGSWNLFETFLRERFFSRAQPITSVFGFRDAQSRARIYQKPSWNRSTRANEVVETRHRFGYPLAVLQFD